MMTVACTVCGSLFPHIAVAVMLGGAALYVLFGPKLKQASR